MSTHAFNSSDLIRAMLIPCNVVSSVVFPAIEYRIMITPRIIQFSLHLWAYFDYAQATACPV